MLETPRFVPILSLINTVRSPLILVLLSHLRLYLPSRLFPLRFPHQNPVHNYPLSHACLYRGCPLEYPPCGCPLVHKHLHQSGG
jgi:hypothetical protein